MLNFIKIDKQVFFLGSPVVNTLASTCLRWLSPLQPGGEAKQTLSVLAPSCIFLWLHENARVIIKCCLRLGSRATSRGTNLFFAAHSILSYAGRATAHVLQCFHPSSVFFSHLPLSLSFGLPLCWRVLLGPRGVCAIFLRPNVAGIAATLSTNLRDYQSQQTKGNLSPLDD